MKKFLKMILNLLRKNSVNSRKQMNKIDIKRLEQEKANLKSNGIEKLSPIEAFYEHQVTNILNKLGTVTRVRDEYNNEWNKITLSDDKIQQSVFPIQLASIVDELPFKGNSELIDNISDDDVLDRINKCK